MNPEPAKLSPATDSHSGRTQQDAQANTASVAVVRADQPTQVSFAPRSIGPLSGIIPLFRVLVCIP